MYTLFTSLFLNIKSKLIGVVALSPGSCQLWCGLIGPSTEVTWHCTDTVTVIPLTHQTSFLAIGCNRL